MLLGAIGVVVAGAIGAALFGLPVRTWFAQNDDIAQLQSQLRDLGAVNTELQRDVDELKIDDGIVEAARERAPATSARASGARPSSTCPTSPPTSPTAGPTARSSRSSTCAWPRPEPSGGLNAGHH